MTKRRTRQQKLMDVRIAANKAANHCDIYTTNKLLEAIDYLFFEVELLTLEVDELKAKRKARR